MMIRTVLTAALMLLLSGCGAGEKADVLYECPSPDGSLIATLYRVSDGAREIDRETRLNVRPATTAFNDSMFSFAMRHGYDAIVRWSSEQQLEFVYPLDSELIHVENVIFGSSQTFNSTQQIVVTYREEPSTHGYFMVEKRCLSGVEAIR
ncbi:hypothetical protein F3F96_07865 [Mariprofundus sp. NF]|uniref:hypothetical protein n=1 Tax=Mariprofundus sp. NF TaxID=2608716 RepID=UPI0015A1DF45|nr:hypothetical protein [Mariprofundus sp. NF]NWF39047.1 hypothetical protein [Mariprofundus sp. NF]